MREFIQHLLPPALRLLSVQLGPKVIECQVEPIASKTSCPGCGELASHLHSHYERIVFDLPLASHSFRFRVQARKFFCRNPGCDRKVFCERLPSVVKPYGRKTLRFFFVLQNLSLQLNAQETTRVFQLFGSSASPDVSLRAARQFSPQLRSAEHVGLDDWAKRKGLRYGSILVDLDTHRVIEVLDSREPPEVLKWFQGHPEIRLVSRDRGLCFQDVTRQLKVEVVADRWHLMKNLGTAFENSVRPFYQPIKQAVLARKEGRSRDFIPSVEPSASDRQFPLEQALELQKQGKTIWQISKIIRFDRRTTRKYLQLGCIPEHGNHRNFRRSKVAAYEHLIQQELALPKVNISRLYRNMQQEGFMGSRITVRSYMLSRYPEIEDRRQRVGVRNKPVSAFQPITYKKLVWLLLNFSEERSIDDRALLETIQKDVPGLWNLRELIRVGLDAFRDRDLPVFLTWVETVLASDYSELKGYIGGLKKDWEAVLNSFNYAYSNGPVEGQVNRLKCIKRQMYGRAKFDLLRLKVLFQSRTGSSPE